MDARAVIERLKSALDVKTDAELASKVDVPTETINSWKRRGSIPIDNIIRFSEVGSLNVDWLLFGRGQSSIYAEVETWGRTQVQEGVAALRCALSSFKLGEVETEELVGLWLHWRSIISVTRSRVVAENSMTSEEAIALFLERWNADIARVTLSPVKTMD